MSKEQDSSRINLFEEELNNFNLSQKKFLSLNQAIEIKLLDENNEPRINLTHIPSLYSLDKDKKGYLINEDFIDMSDIVIQKEKTIKRYELNSILLAYFNIQMLKEVFSEQGENKFVTWILNLFRVVQYEYTNPDLSIEDLYNRKYSSVSHLSKEVIELFYSLFNINLNLNLSFEGFYELVFQSANEIEGIEMIGQEVMISIDIIDIFATQYVRGFCKMIVDIGYDELLVY